MGGVGAILIMLTMLILAPMVLGSYVVAQNTDPVALRRWFGVQVVILVLMPCVGIFVLFVPR